MTISGDFSSWAIVSERRRDWRTMLTATWLDSGPITCSISAILAILWELEKRRESGEREKGKRAGNKERKGKKEVRKTQN